MVDSDPRFTVFQWGNELANVSLIRNGLLGCTPTSPKLAFTFQALQLYHQLQQHQSSFSIQAYTKVLCVLHGVTYWPHFQNQFSMMFDVYLAILCTIQSRIDQALGCGDPDWRLQHYCPVCMFKQPGEPLLIPSSLKAMDGNNSTKWMDRTGHTDHHVFPSAYMISRADVDTFKDDHGNAEHHNGGGCADTWQAASAVDEDTVKVFKQTGIFLSACRHGIILTCAEMLHSGELTKYPLAMINKLISVHSNDQVIGSDIGCSLSTTLAVSSIAQMARAANVQLIVNAFHGHAHNHMCQLQYHPLYLPGTGLEDFETCECIFSSSNATTALVHHASYLHYIQYLELHFSQWDADKYAELSTSLHFRFV
ncbi:hypothetical protein EDC04DRAFT_2579080 [Pisolithus marmoratus]|nr:hypothetical protein EDC04DRAFT_2579080 [Pisolithus marmoratus]